MAPHGADVGVYVRGALSGFAACRRKAKHGDIHGYDNFFRLLPRINKPHKACFSAFMRAAAGFRIDA